MLFQKIHLGLFFVILSFFISAAGAEVKAQGNDNIYQFKVQTADQSMVSLDKYKGRVLLVVNVASKCGYTNQYEGLEELYKKYNAKGFAILAFPSNQFLGQEPGSNEEIQKFCKLTYGVTFPVFAKVDVKGDKAIDLYKWFIKQKNSDGKISWNFNKFLIDQNGQVLKHFGSSKKPSEIEPEIKKLLGL